MAKPQILSSRVIFGLIVVHLAIVLPLAWSLNIWSDEASTLYTTEHGFWSAFQNAATNEKQSPLYFWLLALWRLIDGSIFFARLFSIICSLGAIAVFADLARKNLGGRAALLVSMFFALHPFLIWASLEIRVYSLVVLLSVVLVRLFFAAYFSESTQDDRRLYAAFAGVSIFALYANYYIGFLLAGMLVSLVLARRSRQAVYFVFTLALVALTLIPLLLSVWSQYLVNTGGYQEPRTVAAGATIMWHHFVTFLLPGGLYSEGEDGIQTFLVWALRVALVAIAALVVLRFGRVSNRSAALFAIVATIFACFFSAYMVLGGTYVALRHASVLLAPLSFLAASLLTDLCGGDRQQRQNPAIFVGGLIVLLAFSYSMITLYPSQAKRGDWIRVARFIEENEAPDQPILVFTVYDALALPYHYGGINRVLPDKRFYEFDQLDAAFGTPESLKRQTDFLISEIPAGVDQIWLAVNEKCLVTQACVPLENFIAANYTIDKEQQFYLEKVYLLRKKSQ